MVYKKRKIKVFRSKKKKESIDVVIAKLKESYEQVTFKIFYDDGWTFFGPAHIILS